MILDQFNGLPTHILLAHFVVVLVPLSALALVVCALWPEATRRLGPVLPLLALVSLAFVPFTTHAGEWLKRRVGASAQTNRHVELGDGMLPWTIAVAVMALVVWWVTPRETAAARTPTGRGGVPFSVPRPAVRRPGLLRLITAVLAVAAAVGSVVHVYRVGDSGSKAVWQGVVPGASGPGGAGDHGRVPARAPAQPHAGDLPAGPPPAPPRAAGTHRVQMPLVTC